MNLRIASNRFKQSIFQIAQDSDWHNWHTSSYSFSQHHDLELENAEQTSINDNFKDLEGRISKEALNIIRRLHQENPKNSFFQPFRINHFNNYPPSQQSSSTDSKEYVRISGRLDII
ncbi:unnamed protein product [Dracunculus medinensis]|uniref:Uncharacterized protein n=1 Tax=Dracunculus medinensis TaxID=318479 RepID=A0A0N4ULE2_DRAME|nr:unnamed protein product [Dracunculus medinensis]